MLLILLYLLLEEGNARVQWININITSDQNEYLQNISH